MEQHNQGLVPHPAGEQPSVAEWSATAETFAGLVHVEWDTAAPLTPFGQLPSSSHFGELVDFAARPGVAANFNVLPTVLVSLRCNSARMIGGSGDFSGSLNGHYRIRRACACPGSPSRFPAPLLPVPA